MKTIVKLGRGVAAFFGRRVAEREAVVNAMTSRYCRASAEEGKPCVMPALFYKGRMGQ